MDNQFKNIKAHARGQSKGTWYEWRSKLFEGLTAGLEDIRKGMVQDDKLLVEQENVLQEHVPALIEKHGFFKAEVDTLQSHADEIASCDQFELQQTRARLATKEEEIAATRRLLAELQEELKQKNEAAEQITDRKTECTAEIQEAERVAEVNRGWDYQGVKGFKGTQSR